MTIFIHEENKSRLNVQEKHLKIMSTIEKGDKLYAISTVYQIDGHYETMVFEHDIKDKKRKLGKPIAHVGYRLPCDAHEGTEQIFDLVSYFLDKK